MTREQFKKDMAAIVSYMKWEDDLYELNVKIWEDTPAANLCGEMIASLNEAFSLPANSLYGTELDYYIYELDFGTKDEELPKCFSSVDALYDYLCEIHEEVQNQ